MLFALRDYIAKEKSVSCDQLSRFFQIDVTALEPLLEVWVKKGVIKRSTSNAKSCLASCGACHMKPTTYYYKV